MQHEKLVEAAKFINKKSGDVIFVKGSLGSSKLVIAIEGSLKKVKLAKIKIIKLIKKVKFNAVICKKGEVYGDEFLAATSKDKKYIAI